MSAGVNTIRISRSLLVLLFISVAWQIWQFFRVKHQLLTPLVPQKTIMDIATPPMVNALATCMIGILALLLYYLSQHRAVIVICILSLAVLYFLPEIYYQMFG